MRAPGRLVGHLRMHAVAYLALFVALGGTSYAALSLPKNSVGTKQLRNGAVTTRKIAAKTRAALRGRAGPQGPAGATGSAGAAGASGAPGAPGPGAKRFALERTADSGSAPTYSLGTAYGVTIKGQCTVSGGPSELTGFLLVDPDQSGTLTYSGTREWTPSNTTDTAASSANILGSDAPYPMFGQSTSTNDHAYATVQAAFDDGSTTVLINAFVALDNTNDRCHMFGGIWPAS